MNNKPPDKLRTIKCSFKKIIKNKEHSIKIFDAVVRTHKIITHAYQFLRLYILYCYKKNKKIIDINTDTIKMVFKVLVKDSAGPKPKGNNLNTLTMFKEFYEKKYKKLYFNEKIDGSNLSQILNYMAIDMLTNIENNIKLNFSSYVKRFVNSSFKKINNDLLDNAPHGTKIKLRKELNKDLHDIKEDLFNNTLLSNVKYHEWINKHRKNIFPSNIINSFEFDIKQNPQKYLRNMIYMCNEIESIGTKLFQFFPLRNNITSKYVPIDTKSLVEILVDDEMLLCIDKNVKQDLLNDIENNKHSIWSYYFNLNNKVFKQSNYSFDYRISTDCIGTSIQLIHNDFIETSKNKKLNMKIKKQENKVICKNMSIDEKNEFKQNVKLEQHNKQQEFKLKLKMLKDKQKEEFKNLSKEDKINKKLEIVNKKYIEFPYLEDLNDNQLNNLKNNNWLCIDPGKKCLLFMKDKNGKKLKYTNKYYIMKIKRIKYQRLLKNYKDKNDISKIENELSKYNSKSCNFDTFKQFVKNKNKIFDCLLDKYNNEIFRKYKWYGYINKKKEESNLVNQIKNTFGKDIIINFGDWSIGKGMQMKNHISTPNLGLKRKLAEHFTVYNLDEFRTSKLNYKTEEICENLYLPDKNNNIRKLHSVLTYQTESKRSGCINRDNNSVNNMIKLVDYYLLNKDRPEKFKRSYKLDDKKKDTNPNNLASNVSIMP
jgi:hypothetical protein